MDPLPRDLTSIYSPRHQLIMTVTSVAIFVGVFVSRQDYLKAVGVEFSGTPDEISDQECDYLCGFRWTWDHAMSTLTRLAADRVPHDIDESEPLVIGIKLGVIFGLSATTSKSRNTVSRTCFRPRLILRRRRLLSRRHTQRFMLSSLARMGPLNPNWA
jgi:hypothetical protein